MTAPLKVGEPDSLQNEAAWCFERCLHSDGYRDRY